MNKLPTKYSNIIKKDEKVIWHDKPDTLLSFPIKIFLLMAISILMFIIFQLIGQSSVTIIAVIFIGWGIFSIIRSIFTDFNYYIATDKRIYIKDGILGKVKQYNYSRIHSFNIENDDIIIYADVIPKNVSEDEEKYLPRLSYITDKNNVKNIIEEHWFTESPYQIVNNEIEVIAKKYNLITKYIHPASSERAELKGTINGLPILVTIKAANALERFTIAIDCPNAENNYLKIAEESSIAVYKKVLGIQDLKVGNPRVDYTFLFQSDHQIFFDYVMTDEIQQNLLKAWEYISGNIEMGDAKNIKNKSIFSLKKKKIDDNILDDDLMEDLSREKKRKEGATSTLVYHSNELDILSNNLFSMTKNINFIFETVLTIALRIQEYDKQTKL